MKRTHLRTIHTDPQALIGQSLRICGWVRTVRESKNCAFIELNDGSHFKNLQDVLQEKLAGYEEQKRIPIGSALEVTGTLVASPAAGQPVELTAEQIAVVGLADADFPLQKKRHSFEYLRTIGHLRPRTNTFLATFRVRSLLAQAIHAFMREQNFVYVHTPIITASDCEGAGEMFAVTTLPLDRLPKDEQGQPDYAQDFFGKPAYLTVSGQLDVEAFCMAFDRVYTFGPTFRAENSNTQRHASEFWMVEPEIAFAGLCENMDLAEALVRRLITEVLEKAPEEMEFFNRFIDPKLIARLQGIVRSDFARLTYTEAIDILQKSGHPFQFAPEWGADLQTEHERYLAEQHCQKPVFVTDYPKAIKAFYMRQNEDGRTVGAMDLLVPEVGEIIGGSVREERHDVLLSRIRELSLPEEAYGWYLALRRFGSAPHAGFGLGFDRAVMYLTGMQNIRDVLPFPRTPGHADF